MRDGAAVTELAVNPQLIDEIRRIVARHPPLTWMPVSELYADLPPRVRREHVRPHKSMLHVLQKARAVLGISLNATGIYFAVGDMPVVREEEEAAPRVAKAPKQETAPRHARASTSASAQSPPAKAPSSSSACTSSAVRGITDEFKEPSTPPVDFFFDVGLNDYPPPPADFDVTMSQLQRRVARSSADGAVIAMSDFVAYIPPFFAPVSAVVANMPGYTEEHIEIYFQAAAMELVTVCGQRYIRLHGGYGKLSLAHCAEAEETFAAYKPDPSILGPFVEAFHGVTDKWMPLPELLSHVDPDVVRQLPFQGPAAIIFFAQMQHRFSFAVRQGPPLQDGAAPVTEAAVLLRREDYGGLECETSPTPKSLSLILSLVPTEGNVEIADVERQLTPAVRAEVQAYFGSIARFFAAHAPVFFVPPETPTLVMRLRHRQRIQIATLSLEEQLKDAIRRGNKKKMRVIRRRLAFRDNPSHPFLDPDNLAKELHKHLPRRGFVSLKTFLQRSIPEELLLFMPPKVYNFFNNYPQYFTQFEYQHAGSWCVSRPDQPIPRGVIRQDFSESDLVRLIAEYAQRRGARALSTVLINLPRGAQERIKRRYGGIYFFVIRYPQYFNVVLGSDNDNAQSSGILHLVQVPSVELTDSTAAQRGAALTDPHAPSDEESHGPKSSGIDSGDGDDEDDYDGLD